MESVRERIFVAIENILKTVSGIGTVTRGKIDPLEILDYPAAFPSPGQDAVVKMDIGTFIDRQLTVYTMLWIKEQGTGRGIHQVIEEFLPLVQKALAADYTLGGLTLDFAETTVHEPFLSEAETEAAVILEHAAIYRVNRLDPYSQQ